MRRTTRTNKGDVFSEGSRLLWRALASRSMTASALREKLTGRGGEPLSNGQVGSWLYGDTRPGLASAMQLLDVLGIPLSAWTRPPSRDFVLPAARHAAERGRSLSARKGAARSARAA